MKKSWWSSLRTKIIAWSFIPTVIILSAVAWFTFYSYQKVIGDLAMKQDLQIVRDKSIQGVNAVNNKFGPTLLSVMLDIDILHQESLEVRAENILNQAQGLEMFDGGIYFLDQDGRIFKTWPEQPELISQNWSDTPQFRYLLAHNNMTVPTDLFPLGTSGKKVVCTAMAMIGQEGETAGAVYFCYVIYPVTQNVFYQELNSANLGFNVLLIDGNLQVIYSQDPSDIGKDLSGEAYLQQLLNSGDQSGRFRIGTEEMVASYVPLFTFPDSYGWMALKKQRWAEIMQPSLGYRQLLYLLLALGVIVPLLVTTYGVRHITEPIQKLIRAAGQVTAGQFKQRIEVKTGDEIETLADQFNVMSAKLEESYASLEKKVADRTRELAIMNSIISVTSQSLDIQDILEHSLNHTVAQMGFDAGAAFRLETEPAAAVLVTQRGFEDASALELAGMDPSTGRVIHPEYLSTVSTIEVNDVGDENLRNRLTRPGFRQLVHVPLSTKGRGLGFFILGKRALNPSSPEELSLLTSIGQQIGVAMENAHLYEQAKQTAVTAERTRLARELHDAVTQTLFSANLIADVIPRIWERNPDEGMQNLDELRQLTRGALAEMRTLLLEMRPESLERTDIKSLVTQLADAFIGRVRVPVSLVIQGHCQLDREVKIAFYRVAQEALNNIAKHSGARQVDLHLEYQPGRVSLHIKDDGLGFDPASITPDHLGIAIMRERAGSIGADLKIESQIGQGTTIELNWNLNGGTEV
jgi:nitrate/nitrite-specific signal transduction histidine kinase